MERINLLLEQFREVLLQGTAEEVVAALSRLHSAGVKLPEMEICTEELEESTEPMYAQTGTREVNRAQGNNGFSS